MGNARNRKTETVIYAVVWLLAIGLYLVHVVRGRSSSADIMPLFDGEALWRMLRTFAPFVVLFLVNNCLLIPRLLLRNRNVAYLLGLTGLLVCIGTVQYVDFIDFINSHSEITRCPPPPGHRHGDMRPLLAMPLFIDFLYDMLIAGCNIAAALIFQRYDDRLAQESLRKADAENRLSYLKAQINPHFYMNMLNNIHGMIEIAPAKAQDMVLDMSRLMRYMLYDSSQQVIALSSEIRFLKDYLGIMRYRYPENKVRISAVFPSETEVVGINIPPLLFLVYIENAFKHGVSYRVQSFVAVNIAISPGRLEFSCINSVHTSAQPSSQGEGIGLRNVEQRLALIYGHDYNLAVDSDRQTYKVILSLPL